MAIEFKCEAADLDGFLDRLISAQREAASANARNDALHYELSVLRQQMTDAVSGNHCNPPDVAQLIRAMRSSAKIGAIKWVRTMTGLGLKDAKDLVENNWDVPYMPGPHSV